MTLPLPVIPRPLGERYDVQGPLGSGTAANVFRVRDRRSGVLRAAKVLKPENAASPKILARFEDEFRILRTLRHPHLPEVYDYGWTQEGGRFLVMELVDGVPLDEFFRANPSDIWSILYELCETLSFVHDHKLLHQDVKPSNILVKRTTAYGRDLPLVKLIDFGLTYRRDAGAAVELVGTPEYVAPEVARGDSSLTRAVDYYSLGVTLFELLVGRTPFEGHSSEVLRAHLDQEPVIEDEQLEWAELYPHVRALLTKEWRPRLEAFEEFRRAVTSRLTGGIDELDRSYALARTQSAPVIGKDEAEEWLSTTDVALRTDATRAGALDIRGRSGPSRHRLVDHVCAEGAIRGFRVVRLGTRDGADGLLAEGRALRQVDRFDKVIERFQQPNPPAVLLVIDGIERLNDDEAGFIRYVSTKRALESDNLTPFLYVTARGAATIGHALDPYIPSDRQTIQLPADLPSETREEDDDIRAHVMASGVLEGERSEGRRRLLAYAAAHPAAVRIEWAREFARRSAAQFADDLEQLNTRHLILRVVVGGADAIQASEDARAVVEGGVIPRETTIESHRDLAARLTRMVESSDAPPASICELIAYHHAAIGEDRLALVARIRAVKAAWRTRSLSLVERLCQTSLESLATSTSPHARSARRHFAKQWVRALWARNQHTKAKQVIDDHIIRHCDPIPPGLLPKYIRGILDAEEPSAALAFVDGLNQERLSDGIRQQVLLEKALLLCHSARHEESLVLLDQIGNGDVLCARDHYRTIIYRAMNFAELGAHKDVESLLSRASPDALEAGCNDEFALMSAIRAQGRTLQGRPRDALRIIACTMRMAQRHGLDLRLNALYRLAATAYRDLGQHRRALLSQQKAITLASALGVPSLEAMSWIRLSEYGRSTGHLGNALRYIEKAQAVMAESSYETERAQLQLLALGMHCWLRSPDLKTEVIRARWIENTHSVNERGRYHMMMGNYWADHDDWSQANRLYAKAAALLGRSGFIDNLIILSRARQRLSIIAGAHSRAKKEHSRLHSRKLKMADSANGQLERALARLEFAYHTRSAWRLISQQCETCLRLAEGSVEARIRLEALVLIFRAYARYGRPVEAEAVLGRFWQALRSVTVNLGDRYQAGLMTRLDVIQLAHEYELVAQRNKAGV